MCGGDIFVFFLHLVALNNDKAGYAQPALRLPWSIQEYIPIYL